jgi:hypothetical protein
MGEKVANSHEKNGKKTIANWEQRLNQHEMWI